VLTIQAAAAHVRLTPWALYRAIQRGDLTAYKPGGRLRVHESDLESWLESTKVAVKAQRDPRRGPLPPIAIPEGAARPRAPADSLRSRVRASRSARKSA
jgi:excisionase family DNA binding protein